MPFDGRLPTQSDACSLRTVFQPPVAMCLRNAMEGGMIVTGTHVLAMLPVAKELPARLRQLPAHLRQLPALVQQPSKQSLAAPCDTQRQNCSQESCKLLHASITAAQS